MYTPEIETYIDPVLKQTNPPIIPVKIGPSTDTWNTLIAENYSNSQIQFTIQDIREEYVLNRRLWLNYVVRFTITSSAGNPTIFPAVPLESTGLIGLYPFAIQRAATNFTVTANSSNISIQSYRYLDAIRDYNSDIIHFDQRVGSIVPYKQNPRIDFAETFGTPASPMSPLFSDTYSGDSSWATTVEWDLISDDGATAVLEVRAREMVTWLFNDNCKEIPGLANISSNLKFKWTLENSIISSSLKIDNINLPGVNSVVWNGFVAPPILEYNLRTVPGINLIEANMASEYYLRNFGVNTVPMGTINSGATITFTSASNYNYTTFPRFMLMYALPKGDLSPFSDVPYLRIDQIKTVYIGNRNINISDRIRQEWYEILVRNGLSVPYHTFNNKGIPWIIDLKGDIGEDISSMPLGPNTPMNANIKFEIVMTNLHDTAEYEFYMLDVTDYKLVLASGSQSLYQQALVEPKDIIVKAESVDHEDINEEISNYDKDLMAGSLLGQMSKTIKKGVSTYNKHKDVINNILSTAGKIGFSASQVLLPLLAGGLEYDQAVAELQRAGIPLPDRSGSLSMGALTNSKELLKAGSLKPYRSKSRNSSRK